MDNTDQVEGKLKQAARVLREMTNDDLVAAIGMANHGTSATGVHRS